MARQQTGTLRVNGEIISYLLEQEGRNPIELEGVCCGQQRWPLMCMKWVVLGSAGIKPVGMGTVPSLQNSLTLPLDLSGWGVQLTEMVLADTFGWMGILLSLYLPVNFDEH